MRLHPLFVFVMLIMGCKESIYIPIDKCFDCPLSEPIDTLNKSEVLLLNYYYFDTRDYAELVGRSGNGNFSVCNPEWVDTIEYYKVLNVDGIVYANCESTGERNVRLIELTGIDIIENCLQQTDSLPQTFPLIGTIWYIKEIITDDEKIITPCEAGDAKVRITESDDEFWYSASTNTNSQNSHVSINWEQNCNCGTMEFSEGLTTLAFDNFTIAEFEGYMGKIMGFSEGMGVASFELHNNYLKLSNTNIQIILFALPG